MESFARVIRRSGVRLGIRAGGGAEMMPWAVTMLRAEFRFEQARREEPAQAVKLRAHRAARLRLMHPAISGNFMRDRCPRIHPSPSGEGGENERSEFEPGGVWIAPPAAPAEFAYANSGRGYPPLAGREKKCPRESPPPSPRSLRVRVLSPEGRA